MKIYYGTKSKDFVWLEIENNKIYDLAVGNHYAGCRCSMTEHPLEQCKGFSSCLESCLKQMRDGQPESFAEVKMILGDKYKNIFDKM
jgi:hypothetical protein